MEYVAPVLASAGVSPQQVLSVTLIVVVQFGFAIILVMAIATYVGVINY